MFVNLSRFVKPRLMLGASMLTTFGMMMSTAPTPVKAASPQVYTLGGVAHLGAYPWCTGGSPTELITTTAACAAAAGTTFTIGGTAGGVNTGLFPTSANVGAVTIDNYFEPCAPVAGGASGTIGGANYQWTRVGLVAVVLISGAHTGAAAAVFAPVPSATVHSCVTSTGPLDAIVLGVGATVS
jgi:hypothetical protein